MRFITQKNRSILREMVATDFKVRYQGSVLGYAWSVLRPLFLFLILYIVFTKFLKIGTGIPHYPVYLLMGIVLWSFFTEATNQAMTSVVSRGDLIKKISIPRYLVVVSTSFSALINLGLNLVILLIIAIINGVTPMFSWLMLPFLFLELFVFATATGFFLSALFVKYRDSLYVWEVILQAGFYATPILYPLALVAVKYQPLLMLNPMAQIIQDSRWAFVSHETLSSWKVLDMPFLLIPFLIIIGLIFLAINYFKSQAKYFAGEYIMQDDIAIKVEHISKTFYEQASSRSFKEAFVNLGRKITGKNEKIIHRGDFTALKDIDFEIKKGEFFGIVGRNGCGKSTLLKIIAGVYSPTKGAVTVNGVLTPFIELGVGFNPELSGRDNVYLNAALLGFTRKQTTAMYDDIVEFAEIKDFMDTKLKNYSSGMQVRLAFSIAIRAQSDILLLDEVLAVGDEAFQRKCFDYFETLKRHNKTVILVTHDMASVERFCDRAMFINLGKIESIGKPHSIASEYSKNNNQGRVTVKKAVEKKQQPFSIKIDEGKRQPRYVHGSTIKVRVGWQYSGITSVSATVMKQSGERIFWTGTYQEGLELTGNENNVELSIDANLSEGTYFLAVSLWKRDLSGPFVVIDEGPEFIIDRDVNDTRWEGLTKLKHSWHTTDR